VLDLVADARPGARWRPALQIAEPSQQLGEAIDIMDEIVRTGVPPTGSPTLDALIDATREDRRSRPREAGSWSTAIDARAAPHPTRKRSRPPSVI